MGRETVQNWINQVKLSTANALLPDVGLVRVKKNDKVFDDRIEVFNPGGLQPGLTVEKLLAGEYLSRIRNRRIADMFKEAGLVEKYGTGIRRIVQGFEAYDLPIPKFEEIAGGFQVTAYNQMASKTSVEKTTQVTTRVDDITIRLLHACMEPSTLTDLMHQMDFRSRKHFRSAILGSAIQMGLIEPTIPDKPRSRFQKCQLTAKGKNELSKIAHDGSGSQKND